MSEPSSSSTSASPSPSPSSGEETPLLIPSDIEDPVTVTPSPSPSTKTIANVNNKPISIQKRGLGQRVTFLSGDPMKIGLIGKKGSLSTVVRALQRRKLEKKQGTLDKSKEDWQEFKKQEGIEEELQTQIRSKNGYLERQDFLLRTDLRQFEIEKELRAKKRRLDNPEN